MTPELVSDGKTLLMVSRRKTAPLGQLGPKQLEWLAARHPGIFRNRVVRVKERV